MLAIVFSCLLARPHDLPGPGHFAALVLPLLAEGHQRDDLRPRSGVGWQGTDLDRVLHEVVQRGPFGCGISPVLLATFPVEQRVATGAASSRTSKIRNRDGGFRSQRRTANKSAGVQHRAQVGRALPER